MCCEFASRLKVQSGYLVVGLGTKSLSLCRWPKFTSYTAHTRARALSTYTPVHKDSLFTPYYCIPVGVGWKKYFLIFLFLHMNTQPSPYVSTKLNIEINLDPCFPVGTNQSSVFGNSTATQTIQLNCHKNA